jgi:methyl-accepting chemotaxis protein
MHTRVIQRTFAPAANLMARLKYAQKFLLVGLVLVATLAFVVKTYLDQQSTQIAFSAKERVGVVYVKPVTALLAQLVAARAVAVQVAAHAADQAALVQARARIEAAVKQLDSVDRSVGSTLAVRSEWAALKRQLESVSAAPATTPQQAVTSYDALTSGALKLIVDAGNNSNLILDPDLDSFYIMDSVINRLPAIVDSAGQAGDMQTAIKASGATTLLKRIDLAVLKGNIQTMQSNTDANYATALKNTKDSALKPALSTPIAAVDSALNAVSTNLTSAVQGSLNGAAATRLGATAATDAIALDRISLPALDHLLVVRIGTVQAAATQVKVIALLGVLIAVYLFVGFFLSVRRSQTAILERLRGLQDHCTTELADGLDAMAAGDLTRQITPVTPPIRYIPHDELGTIATAVNAIRERLISSIESFNSTSENLSSMIGEVTSTAGAVGAASQEMSSTSEDTGKATGEIAQAIGDVAQGAERQVQMVETARQAAEEVTAAANETAVQAEQTAEVAAHAREAAGQGVRAAEHANEAMQAVSDSSQAVTEAISQLSLKSGQIGAIVATITGIAEQTNLLALNAAIEAARAGDQGRGFAVVADEVRKLAEQSQHAAHEISELIATIQDETNNAVRVVEDGAKRTQDGANVVEQTREALITIDRAVEDITGRIEQISASAQQVTVNAATMQQNMGDVVAVAEASSATTEQVSASTEENSASAEQIAASAHELASNAEQLNRLVGRFQITVTSNSSPSAAPPKARDTQAA